MQRIYEIVLKNHFAQYRQMAFLSGPRQVGKTTLVKASATANQTLVYINWDDAGDKLLFLTGADSLAERCGLDRAESNCLPIIALDEIHKFAKWKNFVKGFFDKYENRCRIVVTGSARMNIYRRGGDSLRGRYFPYRIHPFTIGELNASKLPEGLLHPVSKVNSDSAEALIRFGGFPEPFSRATDQFYRRWIRLQHDQIIKEEVRDLTLVRELSQIELLAILLSEQAGCTVNFARLAKHLQTSIHSVQRWCHILENLYFCFFVRPYSKNVARSLLKEPKVYLWDWSAVKDPGRRWENFVASHLLKAVHFWTDLGLANCSLHFLRDKEKREVDFAIIKDRKPWFLVEAKSSSKEPCSPHLGYFQRSIGAENAFQVFPEVNCNEIDCFTYKEPIKVPMSALFCRFP